MDSPSIPSALWDRRHVDAAGLSFAIRERRPEATAPSALPALLVHGNWATSAWWLPVMTALASADTERRLVAPDLRGRGATTGPDHGYAIDALAGDLVRLLDALEIPRAHVVGHSLGSAIAMQLALDHPERVATLAVIAPAWVDGMPPAYDRPDLQVALASDRDRVGDALRPLCGDAASGPFWERLVAESKEQSLRAALDNLEALRRWMPGATLSGLRMPRMVIQGGADPLVLESMGARAAEALRAPLQVLPGVAHAAILEAPAAVASRLDDLWTRGERGE
ncbi:MAG: alpha/beta fold hydrolase [Nannocystaceae bacterium]